MLTDIIWRFLMLQMLVMGALCCSCANEHPQIHFCKSEFVLNADILEEIKVPNGTAFRMEIRRVHKGDVGELNYTQGRYVILKMDSLCRVGNMKTGDKYVIFGNNEKGSIYTNMCRGNMPWSKTTQFYRFALVKLYKHTCMCDPNANYETSSETRKCQRYFSAMLRRGKNCKWLLNHPSFRRCQKLHQGA